MTSLKPLLALVLVCGVGCAFGQSAKKHDCEDGEIANYYFNGAMIFQKCLAGKWVDDSEGRAKWNASIKALNDKAEAERKRRDKLIEDMRTSIVSDQEFLEVVKLGASIVSQPYTFYATNYGDKDQAVFDEIIAQQFRLRSIQKCGGKKECAQ